MREFTRKASVLAAVTCVLAVTGCSKSVTEPTTSATSAPVPQAPAPTAANVQSQMDAIKSNPSLTPEQKKIMLSQGQHALAMAQGGTAATK